FVEDELEAVSSILETDLLLNERFTPTRFDRGLSTRPVSVLHVATHARFQGGRDAFLLTHDGRISMQALSDSLAVFRNREEPLELLMLSACETAAGDDDAALGLAGIAVQSGARSAIGTLWVVNDSAASEVAERFYRGVFDPIAPRSRAVALAEAQRALLETRRHRHPAYWAPFLLIGSWL
ncbi:MAG: CHAT domain-containing protein, partial [Myxococcota bacterium]